MQTHGLPDTLELEEDILAARHHREEDILAARHHKAEHTLAPHNKEAIRVAFHHNRDILVALLVEGTHQAVVGHMVSQRWTPVFNSGSRLSTLTGRVR